MPPDPADRPDRPDRARQPFWRWFALGHDPAAAPRVHRALVATNVLAGALLLSQLLFLSYFVRTGLPEFRAVSLLHAVFALAAPAILLLNARRRYAAAAVLANLLFAGAVFLPTMLFFGRQTGNYGSLLLGVLLPPLTLSVRRRWLPLALSALDLSLFLVALGIAPLQDLSPLLPPSFYSALIGIVQAFTTLGFVTAVLLYQSSMDRGERELEIQSARLQETLEEVRTLADHDGLTGLRNRRVAEEAMRTEIARSERYGSPFSVALLDIDHFKAVNDRFGHDEGDRVLKRIAETLAATVRTTDAAMRWGGEEFLVVLPHTDVEGGLTIAEKLRRAVKRAFPEERPVTCSFGVAEWRPGENAESLFTRADAAMYSAKAAGRDRIAGDVSGEGRPRAVVRIEWQTAWESGDERIDRQHRHMLGIANDLVAYSLVEADRPRALALLDELLEETVRHFAFEESVLASFGYAEMERHRALHAELVSEAVGLRTKVTAGEAKPIAVFQFVLERVVAGHLIEEDTRYFAALHEARSA